MNRSLEGFPSAMLGREIQQIAGYLSKTLFIYLGSCRVGRFVSVTSSVSKVSMFPSGHFASDASSNKAFLMVLCCFLDKTTVQMKLVVEKD